MVVEGSQGITCEGVHGATYMLLIQQYRNAQQNSVILQRRSSHRMPPAAPH